MVQNNWEEQMKNDLQGREIKPSAQAWERLDNLLTASEEKKTKKIYRWVFVAASMLLFFGLGFLLFNNNETKEINISAPNVTTTNKTIDSVETHKINEISIKKEQPVLVQNEVYHSKKQSRNIQFVETNKLISNEVILEEKSTPNSQLPTLNKENNLSTEKLLVENKFDNKENFSDKKNKTNSKFKIDAASLLSTVEKEIDQNHKETTLDKLTKKFQDVKSAIVNRNYE
jgi:hypothetical protein